MDTPPTEPPATPAPFELRRLDTPEKRAAAAAFYVAFDKAIERGLQRQAAAAAAGQ